MTLKTLYINNRCITISPPPFEGKLSIEEYEMQLYKALNKIGVSQKYISIKKHSDLDTSNLQTSEELSQKNCATATISWEINEKEFSFSCGIFETYRENFGACTQAIREDVRHILRGIKDITLVLKQYQVGNDTNLQNSFQSPNKDLLSYNENLPEIEDNFTKENSTKRTISIFQDSSLENEIINKSHAEEIITNIKKKYPNFSNYSYLPDYDRIKLEKAYYYLNKKPHWK